MIVVCDTETDSLDPTKLWLIIAKDVDTGSIYSFKNLHNNVSERKRFEEFSKHVTLWIGHNFISFDRHAIHHFVPAVSIHVDSIIDTLVVSRLFNFSLEAGHSLDSYGARFKFPKLTFTDFAGGYTEEMYTYCLQDVELTEKVWRFYKHHIDNTDRWGEAIQVEQFTVQMCDDMTRNGFTFDHDLARKAEAELLEELGRLTEALQVAFPIYSVCKKEVTPQQTLHGTLHKKDFKWWDSDDLSPFAVGASFSVIEWAEFNPSSPKQVVTRLNDIGWTPIDKTKGHAQYLNKFNQSKHTPERSRFFEEFGWKLSEDNIATLPEDAPEAAKDLVKYLLLMGRKRTFDQWFKAYNHTTGRIHGDFFHIGAWTHRMSHANPNMANTPSVDSKYHNEDLKAYAKHYGTLMRSCWTVPEGHFLVGVDAKGIQLRLLAHYMNDEEFIAELLDEDGDIHALNTTKLGRPPEDRPRAKTFIYAWLLGAGLGKVQSILNLTTRSAKQAVDNFIEGYPGLKELKKTRISKDAHNGYFEGLDGRLVKVDQERLVLAGYLQNGEALVMKHSLMRWYTVLTEMGVPFKLVNFVHDEWAIETTTLENAEIIQKVIEDSLVYVGEKFNLNIPMAGNGNIGKTWMDVH